MPLYFAYGSNMDRAAMAERCPRSKPLGLGRLMRHRFVIMQEGYANVERHPQAVVHGLLYELALSDVSALDRYEAVGHGLYQKVVQGIVRAEGGPVRALIYIGRSAAGGTPIRGYMDNVVTSAQAIGLPVGYIAEIARAGGLTVANAKPKRHLPGLLPAFNIVTPKTAARGDENEAD